jgi:hypothetical protein
MDVGGIGKDDVIGLRLQGHAAIAWFSTFPMILIEATRAVVDIMMGHRQRMARACNPV